MVLNYTRLLIGKVCIGLRGIPRAANILLAELTLLAEDALAIRTERVHSNRRGHRLEAFRKAGRKFATNPG